MNHSRVLPRSACHVFLSLLLLPGLGIAHIDERESYPEAFYRLCRGKEHALLTDAGTRRAVRGIENSRTALFRTSDAPNCKADGKLTVQPKLVPRTKYCVHAKDWEKFFISYEKLSPSDQPQAVSKARAQLKELTELGLYSSAKEKTRLRGPFLPDTTARKYKTVKSFTVTQEQTYIFRVEERPPCDEKTEHTVQELAQYSTHPLTVPKQYYCVNKQLLYSMSTGQELWINAYQTAIEASKVAIRARAKEKRQKSLERASDLGWYAEGVEAPQGKYFSCQHYVGVRGRFLPRYQDGERTGYTRADEQYQCGSTAFVIPNAEPCDPDTEYTIKIKDQEGYFCASKEDFHRATRMSDELMSVADAVHCDPEVLKQISEIYKQKAAAEQKSLEELGAVGNAVAVIDVFKYLPDESGPPLKVYQTDLEDCPGCYLVKYFGPLYGGCGGFCRVQGYTVLIDPEGKVVRFLKSSLIIYQEKTRHELVIPEEGLNRILEYVNRKEALEGSRKLGLSEFFKELDANHVLANTSAYAARWSKATQLWGAGNTVGSFVLHMGFVREKLKLGDWPRYEWAEKHRTGK